MARHSVNGMIWDLLTFRRMISPVLLQILFWAGIGGTFYGTYVLIRMGNWAWWMALVFGVLLTRVVFEGAIILFRTYDRLGAILKALETARHRSE